MLFGIRERHVGDPRIERLFAELPVPFVPIGEQLADNLRLNAEERSCAAAHEAIVWACNGVTHDDSWEPYRGELYGAAAMGCGVLRHHIRGAVMPRLAMPRSEQFGAAYTLMADRMPNILV